MESRPDIGPQIEETESERRPKTKELLLKYMAGDSHEHTVFSNPSTRHEADHTFQQIYQYVREEINEGESEMQFVIFTEHSSDSGDPRPTDGHDLLEHKKQIDTYKLEQREKGKEYPLILSGVETNIISSDGELDVPDEVLSQMDLVIASKHAVHNAFPESNGDPTPDQLTKMFLGLMDDDQVDVIGHITRNIRSQYLKEMDWDSIFEKLSKTKTALEINIGTPMPDWLIEEVVKKGLPVFIGTDAHTLKQFQMLNNEQKALIENSDDNLKFPLGIKYSFWKRVVKILRVLERTGCPPEQVITSSYERLDKWLSKEKPERKIEIAKE